MIARSRYNDELCGMRKSILLLFLLLGFAGTAYAQFNSFSNWPSAEKPAAEDYKLSYEDFALRYGANDTARAIIDMYYQRFNGGRAIASIASGVTSTLGLIANAQADAQAQKNQPPGQVAQVGDRVYPGWVYPVLGVGLPLTIFGFVKMATWNRLELYQVLRRYHQSHQLPPKVASRLTLALVKLHSPE
jgi:hypothetical protein